MKGDLIVSEGDPICTPKE